jgi:ABC-type sugar transport system ATPase subunit
VNSFGGRARLQVSGLSKRYGSVQALDDVGFEVAAGETMALLGENGAGKSTLVKVLSGLVTPDSGTISVDGRVVSLRSSQQSQSAGIAVVQQEYSSVPNLSVAENVFLGQSDAPLLWWRRALARRAAPLLANVGLDYLDPLVPLRQLSVAERQLVEVARVLARDAKVLLFDEPTAALSDTEIERVLDVVRRLAGEGRSVIYVTHRLQEVYRVADRVTVFRDGRNLPPAAASQLSVDDVVTMMIGRRLGQLFPRHGEATGAEVLGVCELSAPGLEEPITFSVRAGEILGLTGQMGSGAGAVVQALAGDRALSAGSVRLHGQRLRKVDRKAGIARGIAYCSADRQLDGMFTGLPVMRNLTSPWLDRISSRGFLSAPRERALATQSARQMAFDTGRLGSSVDVLSGGNQQKVALGRWVGGECSVLLVEEPTRGVDVGARAEIYTRLRELCDQGLAIVVASSDTSEIGGLADTIATFYRGRLTAMRPHEEWTDESLLKAVMHGPAA